MDIGIRADGLNTTEFESFAIEIVKKKFNNPSVHGFKEGKDDGIDGIDDIKSPTMIVQAKRWTIDKNNTTAVKLLKEEVDKIYHTKLKYKCENNFKYIIVTSMKLSPKNLKEIRDYAEEKLPGAVSSDDYIIFSSTLTNLSLDFEYKEIFESYGLIEKNIGRVLNKQKLDSIEAESKDYFSEFNFDYFVETDFLGEAYQILQEEHILLIQGPAGIGKTSTCTILGNLFLNNAENKFDVIVRKIDDIDEIIKLYNEIYRNHEQKSLFVVFDDFLGRNKFDVGERVLQDVKKLYSAANNSNNLFICLNSRTQILQDAKIENFEFQKLIEEKFGENRKFIIDLSKYTDVDKAYIFRRLFEKKMSEINDVRKLELSRKYNVLINKNWKKIIQHRNYFPRLIELIVNNYEESEEDFYKYVLYYLDHPTQLYNNLFEQLRLEEKYLLFSLLLFDKLPIPEKWLKSSLLKLDLDASFSIDRALEKLSNSWVVFSKEKFDSESKVAFLNPSIIDFLNDKSEELSKIKEDILKKSVFLSQLIKPLRSKKSSDVFVIDISKVFKTENKKTQLENQFLERLLNDWEIFGDKELFWGEKLIAIIKSDNFNDYDIEFERLVKKYLGNWNLSDYRNGWSEIIFEIYRSENFELKNKFLEFFEDSMVVENILENQYLDSETLDEISDNLNTLIDEIYWNDNSYYASCFEETTYFSKFQDKKLEILQGFLDNADNVSEINIVWDTDDFDLENEISSQIDAFTDKIVEMTEGTYKWKNIDKSKLDYSELSYNLNEYLQIEFEDYRGTDDEYDRWKDYQVNRNDISIESILNNPLE